MRIRPAFAIAALTLVVVACGASGELSVSETDETGSTVSPVPEETTTTQAGPNPESASTIGPASTQPETNPEESASTIGSASTQPETNPEESATPTLTILKPKDGDAVVAPFELHYEISGFDVAEGNGHMHVSIEGTADENLLEIPLDKESGVAIVGSKLLTGKRDLTFALAWADHTELTNPSARVTIRNLTIAGGRS